MIKSLRGSDFVRHGALVFVAIMAANVFTYVYYALVGRIVGVEGYGVVSALFSATLLIVTAPSTVAATVVARMAADLKATGDYGKLRRLGFVVTVGSLAVGAIAGLAGIALAAPIASFFHLTSVAPVIAASVLLATSLALPAQRGVFQGAQSFSTFAISNIVEAVVKCVAGILLALRFGATGALYGLAIGSFAAALYNAWAVLTEYAPQSARLRVDLRRVIVTSGGIGFAVLAINALLFYDVIIVRHFFPAVVAGLYGASALAGRALYTVVLFVPTIVLPKAAIRSSGGEKTGRLLVAAVGTAAAIVAVAVLAAAVAPRLIITILAGKNFADGSAFVLPYMAALGALALSNVVAMYNIGLRDFAFVVPLAVVAVAEICAVCLWHESIFQVLMIVLGGHVAAFGASLSSVALHYGRRNVRLTGISHETP